MRNVCLDQCSSCLAEEKSQNEEASPRDCVRLEPWSVAYSLYSKNYPLASPGGADEEYKQNNTTRPNVYQIGRIADGFRTVYAFVGVSRRSYNFRRDIWRTSTHSRAELPLPLILEQSREAKVCYFQVAAFGKKDVLGLNIAVSHAFECMKLTPLIS